jgi:hypothetical protein
LKYSFQPLPSAQSRLRLSIVSRACTLVASVLWRTGW